MVQVLPPEAVSTADVLPVIDLEEYLVDAAAATGSSKAHASAELCARVAETLRTTGCLVVSAGKGRGGDSLIREREAIRPERKAPRQPSPLLAPSTVLFATSAPGDLHHSETPLSFRPFNAKGPGPASGPQRQRLVPGHDGGVLWEGRRPEGLGDAPGAQLPGELTTPSTAKHRQMRPQQERPKHPGLAALSHRVAAPPLSQVGYTPECQEVPRSVKVSAKRLPRVAP